METNENEEETLNFQEPSYKFVPKEVHEWRQQGYYLVCKSCELVHAVYIGSKKIIVGIDEQGRPILKDRRSIVG